MTDFDILDPRLQSLERRVNRIQTRLDRTLDIAAAPAFLLPLLSVLIGIVIIGARDETLRRDAMAVVAYGLLPFVTFILGWVMGQWWRSRRWEHDAP